MGKSDDGCSEVVDASNKPMVHVKEAEKRTNLFLCCQFLDDHEELSGKGVYTGFSTASDMPEIRHLRTEECALG